MAWTGRKKAAGLLLILALVAARGAAPGSLVPPPGDDPALGELARQYDRQFFTFNALPFGLSLDGELRPGDRALVTGFFLQELDFQAYASRHPFTVLSGYGEHGDLGMFGGVAAVGDALRYAVLRDSGAPAGQVAQARDAVVRAIRSLHMMQALTGVPGIVARGVMRVRPEAAGDPPIPGCCPATLPLFDAGGNPQPVPKVATWRPDLSPGGSWPDWIWLDDTSKDQVDGYAAALGALWDAVAGDPDVPADAKALLVEDARALAARLMTTVPIDTGMYGTVRLDMVLTDADGRLVRWYGLNPRVVDETTPIIVPEGLGTQNGFNALLGLSVIKVCHHVTGDAGIAAFYYDELVGRRRWVEKAHAAGLGGVRSIYVGTSTNYSNVNMAFTAIYSLLRYEGDASLRALYRDILEDDLYRPGVARQAGGLGQSWFDLIFAGLRGGGTDAAAVSDAVRTLGRFDFPPYVNRPVVNCDAAELAAGSCVAVDGVTVITVASGTGHGGGQVAQAVLPKAIRPPSNFEWRSDPHDFNGGGGNRLNPGGDFRAAYWLGRFLVESLDNDANVSPLARDRWGVVREEEDVEEVAETAVEEPATDFPVADGVDGIDDDAGDGGLDDDDAPSADGAGDGPAQDTAPGASGGCACAVAE